MPRCTPDPYDKFLSRLFNKTWATQPEKAILAPCFSDGVSDLGDNRYRQPPMMAPITTRYAK